LEGGGEKKQKEKKGMLSGCRNYLFKFLVEFIVHAASCRKKYHCKHDVKIRLDGYAYITV